MSADPSNPVVDAAARAYANMNDGQFTAEDVAVYRAWLVWLRLMTPGLVIDDEDSAYQFANACAAKLGIP